MSELAKRVNERMEALRERTEANCRRALAQMNEVEKRAPGAEKELARRVVEIEVQDAENTKIELARKLAVAESATGETRGLLIGLLEKRYLQGRDRAYKEMAVALDRLAYSLFGRSYIEDQINEVIEAQYGDVKGKGNGKSD